MPLKMTGRSSSEATTNNVSPESNCYNINTGSYLTGLNSCCNSPFQDLQLFVVASLGLLPVVLSGTKRCDSQHGDSVSSMVERSKAACVRDNLITKTTHKTTHSTSLCT